MKKKQKPHYVNNKEFTNAIVEYKNKYDSAIKDKKEPPVISDYIAESFMKIAEKLSHSSNFISYSYRSEMVMDGVENCLKVIRNYDITKSTRTGEPNAFGYFTQICYYAFIRRIQKENKQIDIKVRYIEQALTDDISYSEELQSNLDNSYLEKLKEKIDILRKKDESIAKTIKEVRKPKPKNNLSPIEDFFV